jgi:hypothetical protein
VNFSKVPSLFWLSKKGTTPMTYKSAQLEQGVFTAVLIGECELGLAQYQFVDLVEEVINMGATKVLIDGRQLTGNPTEFERFLYGSFAAWVALDVLFRHNVRMKFAYVIHEPLRDPNRLGETVAVNGGMDVKTFEDENEAVEWLNDHEG